jgi:hypothetical protein
MGALQPLDSSIGRHRLETDFQSPFSAAVQKQPDAAISWLRTLPAGPEREQFLELAIRAAQDFEKVKPLVAELSPEAASRAAAVIARQLSFRSPEQARQWAESLPAGPQRVAAWTALGTTRTEPLGLPQGPDRDAMLSGMAATQSGHLPLQALQRVTEIADPALRRRTFDDVMWRVTRGTIDFGGGVYPGVSEANIQKVKEWLSSSEIPEDWRKAWTL